MNGARNCGTQIYTIEYYEVLRVNHAIFNNMVGTRRYHAKWSQLEGQGQRQENLSQIFDLKIHSKVVTKSQRQHNGELIHTTHLEERLRGRGVGVLREEGGDPNKRYGVLCIGIIPSSALRDHSQQTQGIIWGARDLTQVSV